MDAEFFISRAEREVDIHNRVILTARDRVHADGLRRCYREVAQWAKGKETIIRWGSDPKGFYRIPSSLAHSTNPSAVSTPQKLGGSSTQHEDSPTGGHTQTVTSIPRDVNHSQKDTPQSADDELIIGVQLNKKPTGICSLTTGKVLFMNSLMPEFCGLAYDQITVPDIASQFAKRAEREPTDLVDFNERLIKDKIVNGSMKAFRTSGAFGSFHGRFSFGFLNGVPVRISEYDSFEVIQ
jgi:hypothetical protein